MQNIWELGIFYYCLFLSAHYSGKESPVISNDWMNFYDLILEE